MEIILHKFPFKVFYNYPCIKFQLSYSVNVTAI